MANVIDFKEIPRRVEGPPQRPASQSSAQLFLFTGVRYERPAETQASQQTRRRNSRKLAAARSQD